MPQFNSIMRPTGFPDTIDVSHWQGNINWDLIQSHGVKNVIIKCTQGAHDFDSKFNHNLYEARKRGLRVGGYHFMASNQDPDEQAAYFISQCKEALRSGSIRPMLDAEWHTMGGRDGWLNAGDTFDPDKRAKVIAAMLGRWLIAVRDACNKVNPLLYTGQGWWTPMLRSEIEYSGSHGKIDFGDCPLVLAAYVKPALTEGYIPRPWLRSFNIAAWQYSGNGIMAGINNLKHEVDFDKLLLPIEKIVIP